MTKTCRSKRSTKRQEPEVIMKEHGPGGCVDGRPILWNSSDRLLCHSILETSGADWDTMKAKNQSLYGLLFTPRPQASFLLYFPW